MNKEKKLSIICHSVALTVVILMMTILSFKNGDGVYIDLAINHALSNAESFFGIFFMVVGEFPQYFLIPIGGVIFFYNADQFDTSLKRNIFRVFSCILIGVGIFVFAKSGTKVIDAPAYIETGFAIFYALFIGTIALAIGLLVPKEYHKKLFKFAVFLVVFTLVSLLIIRVIKLVWARMRYRDMLKEGNFDGFTPWFLPQIMSDRVMNTDYHYTSFPSGHTSAACHIFVICLLPNYFEKLNTKKWRISLYIVSIVFTVVVAISRIVNNAHYLSDTIIGGALTYAIFYALKYMFFKDNKYQFEEVANDVTIKE